MEAEGDLADPFNCFRKKSAPSQPIWSDIVWKNRKVTGIWNAWDKKRPPYFSDSYSEFQRSFKGGRNGDGLFQTHICHCLQLDW